MQVVSAWYRIRNGVPVIYLRTRSRGKRIYDFRPYCFTPKSHLEVALRLARSVEPDVRYEKTDYVTYPHGHIRVEPAVKLVFTIPKNVARARNKNVQIFYEADIPFVYRYMIDNDISIVDKYRVAYIDIEVDDSKGFPSVSRADKNILSIAVVDENKKERWFFVGDYAGVKNTTEFLSLPEKKRARAELEMLKDFLSYIVRYEMLGGWNISRFDYPYLRNRFNVLATLFNEKVPVWEFWQWFDMQEAYKAFIARRIESFTLEYVAEYEDLPVKKVERAGIVSDLPRDKLEEYNMTDALILYYLDKVKPVTKVFTEVGRYSGVFPPDTVYRSRAIDYLLLRRMRKRGIVLPSGTKIKEEEEEDKEPGYKGAIVFPPPPRGVYVAVGVIDFSGMYPSIIRQFSISPDVKYGLVPKGMKPIYKEILDELAELRKKYKKMRNKYSPGTPEYEKYDTIQLAYKILMNAFYGVLGYKSFRLYDKELAETVTAKGRELISSAAKYMEEKHGLGPLYGDTDSLFIWLKTLYDVRGGLEERVFAELVYGSLSTRELAERLGADIDRVEHVLRGLEKRGVVRRVDGTRYMLTRDPAELLEELAEDVTKYIQEKYNSSILVVDPKTVYSRIYFAGVKKRYAGYVAWEEGKRFPPNTQMDTKGFEAKRSDWPRYVKEYQKKLFEMILRFESDEKIIEYTRDVIDKIRKGKVPVEQLVIAKGLTKEMEVYKSDTPHVRAAKILMNAGLPVAVGDKILFLWIKGRGKDNVVPVDPRSGYAVIPVEHARRRGLRVAGYAPNREYAFVELEEMRKILWTSKYVDMVRKVFERVTGLNSKIVTTRVKTLHSFIRKNSR